MTRAVEVDQRTDVVATGIVGFPTSTDSTKTIKKIPTRGQHHWTLTSIAKTAAGAPAATVELRGTNNEDPSDANGEVLVTNAHAGAGQKDGSAASKGYKYVFVNVPTLVDLVLDRIVVYGTGFAGLT